MPEKLKATYICFHLKMTNLSRCSETEPSIKSTIVKHKCFRKMTFDRINNIIWYNLQPVFQNIKTKLETKAVKFKWKQNVAENIKFCLISIFNLKTVKTQDWTLTYWNNLLANWPSHDDNVISIGNISGADTAANPAAAERKMRNAGWETEKYSVVAILTIK